jgi:hypothetical protein
MWMAANVSYYPSIFPENNDKSLFRTFICTPKSEPPYLLHTKLECYPATFCYSYQTPLVVTCLLIQG